MRRLSVSEAAGRRAVEVPEAPPRDRLLTVAVVVVAVEFAAPVAALVARSAKA
ncbi:hypothetical protein GCM10027091_52160 [Streptomyces daliensis]